MIIGITTTLSIARTTTTKPVATAVFFTRQFRHHRISLALSRLADVYAREYTTSTLLRLDLLKTQYRRHYHNHNTRMASATTTTMPIAEDKRNIVIIGGGIIGCTTAYFLTRHPSYNPQKHQITLLESSPKGVAPGASGKAGGLLALWAYPRSIVPLSFELHRQLAEEHGGKERWGYRGVGVGSIMLCGRKVMGPRVDNDGKERKGKGDEIRGVHAVNNDENKDVVDVSLEKRNEESYNNLRHRSLPKDLDWVANECVEGYESMGDERDTAQVHPYQFTRAMAELAQQAGVDIRLGARVTEVDVNSASNSVRAVRYVVNDDDKNIDKTEKVLDEVTDAVITAGPWTGSVWPGTPISALRAHSVTIRPSRPVSAYALFTQLSLPKNFKDGTRSRAQEVSPEIYARPNNELYACGEGDHLVALPPTADEVAVDDGRCQDIVDYCASFSDEMRDGTVLVRQACYLPQVSSGAAGPLIGKTKTKGVFLAAGHTCWGIQNGPATGKLMSEFVFEGGAKSANVGGLDPRRVL